MVHATTGVRCCLSRGIPAGVVSSDGAQVAAGASHRSCDAQRLAPLVKRAAEEDIRLHFIDAPHELPLQQGQQVPPAAADDTLPPPLCQVSAIV